MTMNPVMNRSIKPLRTRLWSAALLMVGASWLFIAVPPAQAQTYTILYHFSPVDGMSPTAPLLLGRDGKFYGTLEYGSNGCAYGSAFQLKRAGSGWVFNTIHCFNAPLGGDDGAFPINYGGLTVGPDGNLYGTSAGGGINNGNSSLGVVFKLSPPLSACVSVSCPWHLTVLYKFQNTPDGAQPQANVIFDAAGNLYGTTGQGGTRFEGTAFELSPSGGGWTEQVLANFSCCMEAGLAMDHAGSLYGVNTYGGQFNKGYVYQLARSGSGWTENVLYNFSGADGQNPMATFLADQDGNLFGSTTRGGTLGGGTVYELSPSGGGWTFNTLCNFTGNGGPQNPLVTDGAGTFYGTTAYGGIHGGGSVFKMTRSGATWTCTDLHSFLQDGQGADAAPGITLAPGGRLYGITTLGGSYNDGVFYEITQ